jgi:ribosome maturation factor RimP
VRALTEQVVAGTGLVLEDVTVTAIGRRQLLRITVDLPEEVQGGVPIDSVAQASQAISDVLDGSDVMGATPYVLEVSSPGVGRPLTERRHFARARGRIVTVTTTDPAPTAGRLAGVDDAGLAFEDGSVVPWDRVIRGKVQVEFSHPGQDDDLEAEQPPLDDTAGEEEEEV